MIAKASLLHGVVKPSRSWRWRCVVGRCDCSCGWGGGGQEPGQNSGAGAGVSGGFEDRGHTLAAADAHGLQQVAAVPAAQLAQAGGEHPGAGGADGMAERDAGSVDVELVRLVPPPAGQHGEYLDRERLVELDEVDVAESQARSGK